MPFISDEESGFMKIVRPGEQEPKKVKVTDKTQKKPEPIVIDDTEEELPDFVQDAKDEVKKPEPKIKELNDNQKEKAREYPGLYADNELKVKVNNNMFPPGYPPKPFDPSKYR